MEFIYLCIGLILGGVIAWVIATLIVKAKTILKTEFDSLANELNSVNTELSVEKEKVKNFSNTLAIKESDLKNHIEENNKSIGLLASKTTEYSNLKNQFDEVKNELNKCKTTIENLQLNIQNLERSTSTTKANLEAANTIIKTYTEDITLLKTEVKTKTDDFNEANKKTAELTANNKSFNEKLETQKIEIEKLRKQFNIEFENIATKILDDKTKKFTDLNKTNLETILKPLGKDIENFQKKVEEVYDKESKERFSLGKEVEKLVQANQKISDEANNLTKALKGDSKKQGNWGEIILERILERSGLIKGEEYDTQVSTSNDEDKRVQPDMIIFLPEKKHIIIDSKVSLVAYEKYVNAATEDEKKQHIKEHLYSIKIHVKGLAEKRYSQLKDYNTPDFVLLFMPIESSFGVAVQEDNELFNFAWDNKIVIVSPSTLLATLRTIASIWKQENQTKNAIEIARQSGALYDKFVGFISDLEKIGNNIDKLHETYDEAKKKLQTGNGNLIKSVENIRKLGAKTNKSISEKYLIEDDNKLISKITE